MENESMKLLEKICESQAMCKYCFHACLGEAGLSQLVNCIRMAAECSEICGYTISALAYQDSFDGDILTVCITACENLAQECRQHGGKIFCLECAKALEECAEMCRSYMFRYIAFHEYEYALATSH